MAQDFKAAFDLGDSDKTYSAIDAHGVTFAAIQALRERLEEQNARLERLERENAELRECAVPLAYGHVTNACEQAPKSTDR
jgi:hypothetical protein